MNGTIKDKAFLVWLLIIMYLRFNHVIANASNLFLFICLFLKYLFIYLRESERAHEWGKGQRERESPADFPTEHRAQYGA